MTKKENYYSVHDFGDILICGSSIKIDHRLSFHREHADISQLVTFPVEHLMEMREKNARAEREIFESLLKASKAWEELAAQTLLLDKAIEYTRAAEMEHIHTNNEWKHTDYGHHHISNRVYEMSYHIYEKTHYNRETRASVPYAWYLSWSVSTNNPHGRKVKIAGRGNLRYLDKDEMERYIDGRKKTYVHLFAELSPPVPGKYAKVFCINGLLLPGYTIDDKTPEQQERVIADQRTFEQKSVDKSQRIDQ
jgi:hypothetical protein